MSKATVPVIVGAAQFCQPRDVEAPLDPVGMMVEAGKQVLADGGPGGLKALIDTVAIVNIFSWPRKDTPGAVSEALGIRPAHKFYSSIGGNSPQMLVNMAANRIASGQSQAVLFAGGEADYAIRRFKEGVILTHWPEKDWPEQIYGDARLPTSDLENQYDLVLPSLIYALFETALRAKAGRSPQAHQDWLGQLMAPFSQVAAQNPYAWEPQALTPEQIITSTPDNRMITYPYTKRMIANRYVDQSAALIMTSEAVAAKLGIDRPQWVYPMGGADLSNVFYLSQRPLLHESPAVTHASRLALEQAGLTLDQIDLFDLYSCFPSMVQLGQQGIGLADDDLRELTITGGLPYFGGPFNNYAMHAIATAVIQIRENPEVRALILAIGGANTKASVGIYGGRPSLQVWGQRDDSPVQEAIDAESLAEPEGQAAGDLAVEG